MEALITEEDDTEEPTEDTPAGSGRRRLMPEEMDALKARMVREGYPLPDSFRQGNETIWKSLTRGVRRPHLLALLDMTPEQLEQRLREIRKEHFAATGRS